MSEITRLYRYRQLLARPRGLSKSEILEELEISEATFKRDLAKLRDQLHLPVVFDRDSGRYRMEGGHQSLELPGLWFSQKELLSLVTMQSLIEQLEPSLFGDALQPLKERFTALLAASGLDSSTLSRKIRLVHAGKRHLESVQFQTVAMATLSQRRLEIRYFGRQNAEWTQRQISPQRLVHYKDNWYVDAWCHLREGLRSFALDAIEHCEVLDSPIQGMDQAQIDQVMQSSYGIFNGRPKDWVKVRFSPLRARWVRFEQWHPDQIGIALPDGSYTLEFPYSDPREVLGDLLRYGPDVEVLQPKSMRHMLKQMAEQAVVNNQ